MMSMRGPSAGYEWVNHSEFVGLAGILSLLSIAVALFPLLTPVELHAAEVSLLAFSPITFISQRRFLTD